MEREMEVGFEASKFVCQVVWHSRCCLFVRVGVPCWVWRDDSSLLKDKGNLQDKSL